MLMDEMSVSTINSWLLLFVCLFVGIIVGTLLVDNFLFSLKIYFLLVGSLLLRKLYFAWQSFLSVNVISFVQEKN